MMISQRTKIKKMCGVQGCTNWILWQFEPGEPQTRNFPGTTDLWIPLRGCDVSIEVNQLNGLGTREWMYSINHMDYLANNDDTMNELDRIALECYDDPWEHIF